MDALIAMFFTLGLMGGGNEAPVTASPEPQHYQQTFPERQNDTFEERRQRILATNAWLKGLRQVKSHAAPAPVMVAQEGVAPNS